MVKTLLQTVAGWLDIHAPEVAVLSKLFEFLARNEKFMEAYSLAVDYGVEEGLNFLKRVKYHLIEVCRENKDLMKALTTIATKGTARYFASDIGAKAAVKYGVAKVSSHTAVKAAVNVANPAGIICDLTQAGFEYAGYEAQGKTIGKWGNIGTGAWAGFAVGGPPGAVVGALTGFGTWIIGEAVGRAVDDTLG